MKKLKAAGYNYIYVEECASTNTLASEIITENTAGHLTTDGLVVIANNQTAGRGQHGNRWQSQAGVNLTFSLIKHPSFLEVDKNFYLNVIASLAVVHAASSLGIRGLRVKWPNDVYYLDKKICGILTECQLSGNSVSSAVVGIGVNVNQTDFGQLPRASSIALALGGEVCRVELLVGILQGFDSLYSKLKDGYMAPLYEEYLSQQY